MMTSTHFQVNELNVRDMYIKELNMIAVMIGHQ